VPPNHFSLTKQGIIPQGISVFCGYHLMGDKGFSYEAGRHWSVDAPPETSQKVKTEILRTVRQHSYKVCLQFRSLLLMTVFSPTPKLVVSFDSATHQLIWTTQAVDQRYHPPVLAGARIPFGILLTSDLARRRFADLMRIVWVP
jgi:hypothetical protein